LLLTLLFLQEGFSFWPESPVWPESPFWPESPLALIAYLEKIKMTGNAPTSSKPPAAPMPSSQNSPSSFQNSPSSFQNSPVLPQLPDNSPEFGGESKTALDPKIVNAIGHLMDERLKKFAGLVGTMENQQLLSRTVKDASARVRLLNRASKSTSSTKRGGVRNNFSGGGVRNNNNNNNKPSSFKSKFGAGSGRSQLTHLRERFPCQHSHYLSVPRLAPVDSSASTEQLQSTSWLTFV
jgi:hypothetical protein